jgi:transposase-like protein
MSISAGFTTEQIREFVYEYQVQPYGTKGAWLAGKDVSYEVLRRWRSAVFEGDLDRGLIPRKGSPMEIPAGGRTALELRRSREHAAHQAQVARLDERVRELEEVNAALGKAIGLLHSMRGQEPGSAPTMSSQCAS